MKIGKYTLIETNELNRLLERKQRIINVCLWFSGWKDVDIILGYISGRKTVSIEACRSEYAN